MEFIIAIDLGGTFIKLGLLKNGVVVEKRKLISKSANGLTSRLSELVDLVNALLEKNGILKSQLKGIGIAFPGLVNPNTCTVIATNAKYDDAKEIDFCKWANDNWQLPLVMENDARLSAIGEWQYGIAQGIDNVVMMTIGTGIGTGVILEGEVLRGIHFQAGSLGGHFVIDYKGDSCSCGNNGCVETVASTFCLPEIIKKIPMISDEFKNIADNIDFKAIFELAAIGNSDAILIVDQCLAAWGAAIVTYIHAYDPQIVVIGGGIMKSEEYILPILQQHVNKYAWSPIEKVVVLASMLGDDAALHGIEYLMKHKKEVHEKVFAEQIQLR